MRKGFVTLATGSDLYYKLAANLVKSYRYFSSEPLPFAILADRRNKYTELFDDVIILEHPTKTWRDKIYLLDNIPYEQTIFIESDIMVYEDINFFFEAFSNSTDMAMLGKNFPLDADITYGLHRIAGKEWGWFDPAKTGKYAKQIQWIPQFCSDIIFMKQGRTCKNTFNVCMDVWQNSSDYGLKPIDDDVLALGMAANGCKCVPNGKRYNKCVYCNMIVNGWKPNPNMHRRKCEFTRPENQEPEKAYICHWGTAYTKKALYQREARILDCIIKDNKKAEQVWYWVYCLYIPVYNTVDTILSRLGGLLHRTKRLIYKFLKQK